MQPTKTTSDSRTTDSKANASKAMELLEEGITRITSSEEFKRYLSFTRSFRTYSPNNTMLIWLQRPDATMVAGFKKWKEHGRQVKKNEKAIKILAPIVRNEIDEESGEQVRRVVGFRDANVFALESTEGDPVPSPPLIGAVSGEEDAARSLYELLSSIAASEGVEVSEKKLGCGHYGYHDPLASRIVLSSRLTQLRKATTLCHELCHHLLHPLWASIELDTPTKETEAEGASYAICDAFGIDTSAFSFPYVARHARDPQKLQGVVSRIQKVVNRVLEQVDEAAPQTAGAAGAEVA